MGETLSYELRRLCEIRKNNIGLKKEDYENLVLFFDGYYGGKAIDRRDYEILDASISDILKDSSEFINNVIQGVKSYPNDKSKLSERLEIFFAHLNKKYKLEYSKSIFENFKIKDKNERLLMMLKYLHCGERSRSDIADDFGISERTLAEHLGVLQGGFTFLGTNMKIKELERGTNKYRSIIHPIFLALNSAEIYSLTVGLKLLSNGTVFEESLGRIANVVYEQLSESSKDMIDTHKDDIVRFENDEMKFIDSRKLEQMLDSPFTYFLKESIECIVTYNENGEYVRYQGILKIAESSRGKTYNKLKLENNEGTTILDMDNIINIQRVDRDSYFKL